MTITTLRYSEPLIRAAVFAFWRRTVGVGFLVAMALLAGALGFLVWQGDRSWLVGVFGSVLAAGLGFVALLYAVHLRNGLGAFRRMGEPVATMELADASFTLASGLGRSTLPWSSVKEVWRFRSCWLLLFSKAQFVTLPLDSLPADVRRFIVERVQAAGGRVVGEGSGEV